MEAEKEKHLPEKSSSFSKSSQHDDTTDKNDGDNNNHLDPDRNNQSDNHNNEASNGNSNQETAANEGADAHAAVEEPDDEKKDGESTEADAAVVVEEEEVEIVPPAPDLGKVSEEIDQFIAHLSSGAGAGSGSKCSTVDVAAAGDHDHDHVHGHDHDHDQQHQQQQEGGGGGGVPEIGDLVEQFAVLVDSRIADYESSSTRLSQLSDEDSSSFLESITRVSKLLIALSDFSKESNYASAMNRFGAILQRAMSFLEDEFKTVLEEYQIPDPDQDQSNSKAKQEEEAATTSDTAAGAEETETPAAESNEAPVPENHQEESLDYSEEKIAQLSRLAKALVSGGHDTECYQLYFFTRRKALEDQLHKLGFERFSIDDVQKMQWEALQSQISVWINTFKQSSSLLLPNERRLAEAVFTDDPEYGFIPENLCRGIVFQLLILAEAVAMSKRSAEKLFKFLDIYENIRDQIPTMEKLFQPEGLEEIKTEASLIRSRLGEAMIGIFGELKNSIKADMGKTPVPGGAVHPLTRYTMNYLKYACDYTETLEQVFREHKKIDRSDSTVGSDFDINAQVQPNNLQNSATHAKQSPYQLQLMKVMDLLDINLEAKSKLYKDNSLSLIFLMNNGRYILQKSKGTEGISSLMGDPWVRKRSSDLRSYHTNYKRETWGRLLNCLNHEGLNVNGKVVKPVLKERFKSFNAMFDEIHRNQSTWVVSDEQLQSELRVSISAIVIPAYRSFMGRFSQVFTPGRQTEKYIKYQPEDIETHIDELFDGSAAAAQGKKR